MMRNSSGSKFGKSASISTRKIVQDRPPVSAPENPPPANDEREQGAAFSPHRASASRAVEGIDHVICECGWRRPAF